MSITRLSGKPRPKSWRDSCRSFGRWSKTQREKADAIADDRGGRHHPQIPARQICDRRRRRDDLYPRLEPETDARARHLGGPQRDPRLLARRRRYRRHAGLFGRRLDQRHLHRGRSRHPAQFLHGRGWRRLVDRGIGRHRHRPDRGRLLQDGGDFPLYERLFAGQDRRHRRALGRTRRRRHAA